MNPFGYEKTSGLLDRLSAIAKIFFLACLSITVMDLGPLLLLAFLAAGIVIHRAEGISFRPTVEASFYILWLAAFAGALRGIAPGDGRFFAVETLEQSGIYALRLLLVFLYARLFYVSTRVADLGNLLTAAVRRLNPKSSRKGLKSDPGMLISLSMLFLPRIFDSYARVKDAASLRGFTGRRIRFRQISRIIEILVFMGMKNALRTAKALETRGYSCARTISIPRFRISDALLVVVGMVMLFLSRIPGASLP